ncbi:YcaO-related McrA-glycine thioamidation protein [Methanocella sp. CWC-04]|uniref:YcaO-related McrA-glycine thioamidation protein n=1 Tax=Methanooceanicella nereidis TaxID=2052831 RepID=A0AAP2RFK7_9EURY|nr:YcaO-related McrA-glycine thioamidation protein [Methanocella sp. CWC-04]MCD1296182.1 YcaO-related McrA-glycine thioamidation protein [Methanocella sp. CWC-04]
MKITLKYTPKGYTKDTHRVVPPEETLKKVEKLLPGIGVTRVAEISGLDRIGIPVYSAIRPASAKGAISVYAGKGASEVEAKVSVMMEAIERYSSEYQRSDSKRIKISSYEDLTKDGPAIDPDKLILPGKLLSGVKLDWVDGYDLISDVELFLPGNAVFHPYETISGSRLFRSNTNGLASGNTMEEAIFHGLMEVVERDALSIAEATRDPGKEIILTEKDGIAFELYKKFCDANILVKLWYLPTDSGIPTVMAATDDRELMDPALLVMGVGTHLDARIALLRALTEVAQSRATQIHGAREDTNRDQISRSIGYDRMKRLNKHWYVENAEHVFLEDLPDLSTDSHKGDIEKSIEMLKNVVDNIIVTDLTRKKVGIPVVRVTIPGLEMFAIDRERIGPRCRRASSTKKVTT